MNTWLIFHWIFFLILVIAAFTSEHYYRSYLFNLSLEVIKDLQSYTSSPIVRTFFKVTSMFGGRLVLIKILATIFFYPIHKSFMLIFILGHCDLLEGILQVVYSEPRPFWVDKDIVPYLCSGDYGNPSGHAMQSFAIYISFWHIATDEPNLRDKTVFRLFTLFGYSVMIVFILFSRLILGLQTLNQLFFGLSLGFLLYYLFFIVIGYHQHNGTSFVEEMESPAYKWFYSVLIVFSFGSMLFVLFYFDNNRLNPTWEAALKEKCPEFPENKTFSKQAFIYSLSYLMFIGSYAGIQVLIGVFKEKYSNGRFKWNEFNEWTSTGFTSTLLRCLFIMSIAAIPFMAYVFIPFTTSYWIVILVKFGLAYFLMSFLIFSAGIYFSIGMGLANPNIGTKMKHNEMVNIDDSDEKTLMI